MARIEFTPEPKRAIATPMPDGTWFVRCRCGMYGSWGWDRLPDEPVVPCPCEGCPWDVRVVPVLRFRIDVVEDGEP